MQKGDDRQDLQDAWAESVAVFLLTFRAPFIRE